MHWKITTAVFTRFPCRFQTWRQVCLCLADNAPRISLVTKNLPGNNTFYDKKCATGTDVCQVNGDRSLLNRAFSTSTKLTDNSFKGCSELCKKTSGCQAFSIELATGGACRLYKNALVKDFTPNPKNTNIFWDVNCPRAVVNSVSLRYRRIWGGLS